MDIFFEIVSAELNIAFMQAVTCPSLYFHIPFCKSKCKYCGFYSVVPDTVHQVDQLLNAELKELERALTGKPSGDIPSIYIGGGTPSSICEDMSDFIRNVLSICRDNGFSTANTEFTVEVNPGDMNADFFGNLKRLGVTRISIGAQSLADAELAVMGRRHNAAAIGETVRVCRNIGFDNISLDLISSLPGQTLKQWQDNLQKAIELKPEHISVYSLSWEPDTEFERLREKGLLDAVDEELDRQMYYLTIDTLEQAGICQYEISNFARPGMESRHNLRYWDDLDYIGVGPSAGSHVGDMRWNNIANIDDYAFRIKDDMPGYTEFTTSAGEENIRHAAILALRKCDGINIASFLDRFSVSPLTFFKKAIEQNVKHGYLEVADGHICLTRTGLSYADQVARDLI